MNRDAIEVPGLEPGERREAPRAAAFALACGPGLGADGTVQARSSALSSERHRALISSLIWFQFCLLVLGPTAYLWERVVFHL